MAVTLTNSGNSNLLDPGSWTAGNGSVGIFAANGNVNEQNRYIGTDPWGKAGMVWQTTPTGDNGADGGWNTNGVAVDLNKLYRFSVWVRRTSATGSGTFYFGLQTNLGSANHLGADQSGNTNPYWQYLGATGLAQNTWYLYVGHCYPASSGDRIAHPDSGFYTAGSSVKSGNNAGNVPLDCKWAAGTTTATHRTYHYYCADATTRLEFFWPRIDLVDGTQPSIAQLMTAYTPFDCVVFSDGSKQSTKFDTANDEGVLLATSTFSSSGTWTKPAGCRKVIVKLVAGGGGGSGHCESGGGGGYSEKVVDVTGIATVAVTVGGGGSAVGYYAAGIQGGTSSFGPYCSATGGYGANQHASHTGGHGGVGSGGDVNLLGGSGTGHSNNGSQQSPGRGGSSYWGGSSGQSHNNSNPSNVYYMAPGSGGTGGNQGYGYRNGGAGLVVVYAYA